MDGSGIVGASGLAMNPLLLKILLPAVVCLVPLIVLALVWYYRRRTASLDSQINLLIAGILWIFVFWIAYSYVELPIYIVPH
jgi:hypothetical protein